MMVVYKCDRCGSDDIRQEISTMVNPNTFKLEDKLNPQDMLWEDYFYCESCQDECGVEEIHEQLEDK